MGGKITLVSTRICMLHVHAGLIVNDKGQEYPRYVYMQCICPQFTRPCTCSQVSLTCMLYTSWLQCAHINPTCHAHIKLELVTLFLFLPYLVCTAHIFSMYILDLSFHRCICKICLVEMPVNRIFYLLTNWLYALHVYICSVLLSVSLLSFLVCWWLGIWRKHVIKQNVWSAYCSADPWPHARKVPKGLLKWVF